MQKTRPGRPAFPEARKYSGTFALGPTGGLPATASMSSRMAVAGKILSTGASSWHCREKENTGRRRRSSFDKAGQRFSFAATLFPAVANVLRTLACLSWALLSRKRRKLKDFGFPPPQEAEAGTRFARRKSLRSMLLPGRNADPDPHRVSFGGS
jgi:hypothetical protein